MTATGILLYGLGRFVVLAGEGVLVGAVVAAGVIVLRRRIIDRCSRRSWLCCHVTASGTSPAHWPRRRCRCNSGVLPW
jgi:hypothetical protein